MHSVPESYVERVRQVHSQGAFGSCGYQSDWLLAEAEKNLLRTHTTAVSARMLYRLAQQVCLFLIRICVCIAVCIHLCQCSCIFAPSNKQKKTKKTIPFEHFVRFNL